MENEVLLSDREISDLFSGAFVNNRIVLERFRVRLLNSWMFIHEKTSENQKQFEYLLAEIDRQLNSLRADERDRRARNVSILFIVFTAVCTGFSTFLFQKVADYQSYTSDQIKAYHVVNAEVFQSLSIANEYIDAKNQMAFDANLVNFIATKRFYTKPLSDIIANDFRYFGRGDLFYLTILRDKMNAFNSKLDLIKNSQMSGGRITGEYACRFIYFLPEDKRQVHEFLNDDFNRIINSINKLSFSEDNPFVALEPVFGLTDGQVATFHFAYSEDYLSVEPCK